MTLNTMSLLPRRTILKGAVAALLMASTSLSGVARAQTAPAEDVPFDFDSFSARMKLQAGAAYVPPAVTLPPAYANLNYDGFRKIQFDHDKAKWLDKQIGYAVHGFPMGWLFKDPVTVFTIADGKAQPIGFGTDDFNFHDADVQKQAEAEPFPGVAGIRVNYPLNNPDVIDELVVFLGASYFRALGRFNAYGLSARGLLINSWRDGPEEFPRFSEFYFEKPVAGQPLVVYAALESQSVTGAYKFSIMPASDKVQETVMDVTARLYFRTAVPELGIAPLTSMFLFGDSNRAGFDDYRPQVHDSNGLVFVGENGIPAWRALNNTPQLGNSYLWDADIKAFGLYQRDRNFETYQDAGAHYEKRPSLLVTPTGDWGQGSVRLIEIPSTLEADDNIVAFFIPAEPVKAGDAREFSYRLSWGDLMPKDDEKLAHVVETRAGQGGVSGVDNAATLRKFVIDFKGGQLATLPAESAFEVNAEASTGLIVTKTFSQVAANGVWRLVLDVDTTKQTLIELKASVGLAGQPLTETWLYQWRGASA
jgi:glucans biosynthesis protein